MTIETSTRPLALVTGAGGGIGGGVARMLQRHGYDIIAVDINAEAAERAEQALGDGTVGVASDSSDAAQVAELADRIRGEWADRLEVVVVNAGMIVPEPVVDTEPALLRTQIDVVLTAPIQHIAAAAAAMTARGRGKIIATVSMGGILPLPGSATYSAAKAGLRAFLMATSAELQNTGVSLTGIYPGGVDTAMLRREARAGGSMLNFVGKILSVDEVVRAYERALDSDRLEIFPGDSMGARLLAISPRMAIRFLPLLERSGRRGHRAYLSRLAAEEGHAKATPTVRSS